MRSPRIGLPSGVRKKLAEHVRSWALDWSIEENSQRLRMSPLSYEKPLVVSFGDADDATVTVGRYSSISHNVEFLVGGGHHHEWVSSYPFRMMRETPFAQRSEDRATSRGPITVGHDVWIGWRATVLSGVTIGHGAVVGAQTVVSRDVEPYAVMVGNPAERRRYRFDEPTREALLRIAWWDWPDPTVIAYADQLNDADVAGFVERHDPALAKRKTCEACGG